MKYTTHKRANSLRPKNFINLVLSFAFLAGVLVPTMNILGVTAAAAPVKGGDKRLDFSKRPTDIEAGTGTTSFSLKSRIALPFNGWTNDIAHFGGAEITVTSSEGQFADSCGSSQWSSSLTKKIKPLGVIEGTFCYRSNVVGGNMVNAVTTNKDHNNRTVTRSTFNFPITVIDTTQPVVEILAPKKDAVLGGSYTIRARITDVGSGFGWGEAHFAQEVAGLTPKTAKVPLRLVDAANHIYEASVDTTGHNGIYRAAIDVWDKAGNPRSAAQTNILIDNIAPKAEVKPQSVSYDGKIFSSISYELSDNHLISGFSVNGGTRFPLTPNRWGDADNIKVGGWQGATYGLNTFTVYDLAGNKADYTFFLDNKAPEVGITAARQIDNKKVEFSGYVLDENFRHYYYCLITRKSGGVEIANTRGENCVTTWAKDLQRNGNPATSTNQGQGSIEHPATLGSFNIAGLESGEYVIRLVALDRAKNQSVEARYEISIDNSAPVASLDISEIDGNGTITITGSAVEQNIKSHWFEIRRPDGTLFYNTDALNKATSNAHSFSLNTKELANGVYRVRYVATDKFNNRSDDPNFSNPTLAYFTVNNLALPIPGGNDNGTPPSGNNQSRNGGGNPISTPQVLGQATITRQNGPQNNAGGNTAQRDPVTDAGDNENTQDQEDDAPDGDENAEQVAAATTDSGGNGQQSPAASSGGFSWLWLLPVLGGLGLGTYYFAYARREQ